MKVGEFEIELTSARVGGGWQSVGILPNGKKVTSAPSSSREDAEHDVEQQAKAHLLPQRRYDVNRPFESMKNTERKYPDLAESEEAVVMHQADRLLEELPFPYEINAETGEQIDRPECPHCGGFGEPLTPGRFRCMNCKMTFSADLSRHPPGSIPHMPPPKASFYPSSGGPSSV